MSKLIKSSRLYIVILMLILIPANSLWAFEINTQDTFMAFVSDDKDSKVSDSEYKNIYNIFLSNIKPSDNPKLVILAGVPGAGKTTFRKKHLNELKNFHLHDMDEVIGILEGYKKDIKKYGKMNAFNKWWPVAQKIVNQITQYAFIHNLNIIYDRPCCTKESLNNLREGVLYRNYEARMYAFYIPEIIALDRVKKRAEKDNRADIPETVKQCGKRFSAMFEDYIKFLPRITLYCYSQICFKKENGKIDVTNHKVYEEFLNYGKQL